MLKPQELIYHQSKFIFYDIEDENDNVDKSKTLTRRSESRHRTCQQKLSIGGSKNLKKLVETKKHSESKKKHFLCKTNVSCENELLSHKSIDNNLEQLFDCGDKT